MITIEEVLAYHQALIKRFGGSEGIRSIELLESAMYRPFQTFGGEDLYPTAWHKAAAIGESIIKNHPFIDGNKRTGYAMMRLLLLEGGYDFTADEESRYAFVIAISTGALDFDRILTWIEAHIAPLP